MVVDLRIEVVDIGLNLKQIVGCQSASSPSEEDSQHIGPIAEGLGAGAVTDPLDLKIERYGRRRRQRLEYRRASRRDHLGLTVAESYREAAEQLYGGRRRDWNHAVHRAG